jgi:hypothetical protein
MSIEENMSHKFCAVFLGPALICCLKRFVLAATLVLCACAPTTQTGTSEAVENVNYYLPAIPELAPDSEAWRKEPAFTEKELGGFVRDLHNIQTMNAQDTVNYLLRDRGWTRERLRYMDTKVALLVMAMDSGNLEALSVAGPYHMPPDREEIFAVQKHYPILKNMLKAREPAGN